VVWQRFDCHRSSLEKPVLRKESDRSLLVTFVIRIALQNTRGSGLAGAKDDDGSPVNVEGLADG
jgi:hypothetical protein